jgi:protein-L-isoaspartate(D-aspartate) O-methyltransferase
LNEQESEFARRRAEMVEAQLRRRGINDERVLGAVESVPRHEFVPGELREKAYEDAPLPIGGGQTISQPYIVARMTEALQVKPSDRVLEVGTGCGYQAAVLAKLAEEVFTIEYLRALGLEAAERLARLGYENVHVHCGDGTLGLKECAPFDAILVAAAAPEVPAPLMEQLAEGGRLIVPVGDAANQELQLMERQGTTLLRSKLDACRFVPLLGYHGWQDASRR